MALSSVCGEVTCSEKSWTGEQGSRSSFPCTTRAVRAFARQLALASNDQPAVTRILADIAQQAWPLTPKVDSYRHLFRVLFKAFRAAQPTRDLEALVEEVFEILKARFRSNAVRVALKRPAPPMCIGLRRSGCAFVLAWRLGCQVDLFHSPSWGT